MKTVIFGDIHCRQVWKDIIKSEKPDFTIFLGDYVSTHENYSSLDGIMNFEDILEYKESDPNNVILLRGNHTDEAFDNRLFSCYPKAGYEAYEYFRDNKDRIMKNTQWIYIDKDIIFSHAGISQDWLDYNSLKIEDINSIQYDSKDAYKFSFYSRDYSDCGDHELQGPEWIRPQSLLSHAIKGYTQVVGHTTFSRIIKSNTDFGDTIYFCDTLPHEYLIIENNKIFIRKND